MELKILIPIILIISAIFPNILKVPYGRGAWIDKYEKERWAKVLMTVTRIIIFSLGVLGLLQAIFSR
jgi:hypothetical protein